MIEIKKERKEEAIVRNGYLVRSACSSEMDYRDEMLRNNPLEGLLPVFIQDFNDKHEYWYEIEEKESFEDYCKRVSPDSNTICSLLEQIENLVDRLKAVLLEEDDLVINLNNIYVKEERFYFVYQPGYREAFRTQLETMFGELMEYVNYADRTVVSLLYLLHARVRQEVGIPLSKLCAGIVQEERSYTMKAAESAVSFVKEEAAEVYTAGNNGLQEETRNEISDFWGRIRNKIKRFLGENRDVREKDENAWEKEESKDCRDGKENKGGFHFDAPEETTLLRQNEFVGDAETSLLVSDEISCSLEPLEEGGETIRVTGYPFYFGKEKSKNAYCFSAAFISRRHAVLEQENMCFYLTDRGSKNGTSVNGKRLAVGERCRINSGDIVGFADLMFLFRL